MLDRYRTVITVVLVAAIIVGGGVLMTRTFQLRELMAGQSTDEATLAELTSLKERQQALLGELAKLQEQAAAASEAAEAVSSASDQAVSAASPEVVSASNDSGIVHLNSANQAALETLPGIGASKAQAILDYRTANGRFKSIDELDNVKGIGAATVAKLKPHLTLD